jgi:cysteine desulfuration protein SufE
VLTGPEEIAAVESVSVCNVRRAEEGAMSEIKEIVEAFEFLGDWDARYQYLIEVGESLPPMAPELKTDANWVKPCMSRVHVAAQRVPGEPELIRFVGDCDTAIIKGVLALLINLLSYRSLEAINGMDVDGLFSRLQLDEHLSPNRHVGIYAIVEKMRECATELGAALG